MYPGCVANTLCWHASLQGVPIRTISVYVVHACADLLVNAKSKIMRGNIYLKTKIYRDMHLLAVVKQPAVKLYLYVCVLFTQVHACCSSKFVHVHRKTHRCIYKCQVL